jgi:hypothetical protein
VRSLLERTARYLEGRVGRSVRETAGSRLVCAKYHERFHHVRLVSRIMPEF